MTPKRKAPRRRLRLPVIILLMFALLLLFFGYRYYNAQKAVGSTSETVSFTVDAGTSSRIVLKKLAEAGLVRDEFMGYLYARQNNLTNMKAGSYTLDKSWDLEHILTVLNDPNGAVYDQVSITIIEGDWAKDIAAKIASVTNVSREELLAKWNDEQYVRSLMKEYPFLTEDLFQPEVRCLLEGYLFPDTYNFFPKTDADTVTRTLLNAQLALYNQYKDEIAATGLKVHAFYTLASIVQYESGRPEDMAKIAQIFFNRLQIDMPLQSSVTVCYALDLNRDTDDWKACEVNPTFDSPYNTYLHKGLPPGPILNPGEAAIQATLHPDTSMQGYYYFMADVKTGTVHYAKTLAEHNENVKKYDVVGQ